MKFMRRCRPLARWALLCALLPPSSWPAAAALELRGGGPDGRGRHGETSDGIVQDKVDDHVVARPEPSVEEPDHEHSYGKRWNIESPEGGSDKSTRWRKKKGGGTWAWMGAICFVALIGSLPVILAWSYKYVTKTQILESALLYLWLGGGLYLFTQVMIFQSPHFHEPRTLSIEEAIYLFAQILTTVGYGDITPARPRGQLFLGLFILGSVLLISQMITELLEFFQSLMEKQLGGLQGDVEADGTQAKTEEQKLKAAFEPVIYAALLFCCFVAAGTAFYVFYPGEKKTPAQGVYMSLITLSTIGFGAFTPSTHAGMVFGAFWMVFGSASLVSVITSRGAFSLALKRYEIQLLERKDESRWKAMRKAANMKLPSSTRLAQTKVLQKERTRTLRG